jgi:hypothetical protein
MASFRRYNECFEIKKRPVVIGLFFFWAKYFSEQFLSAKNKMTFD